RMQESRDLAARAAPGTEPPPARAADRPPQDPQVQPLETAESRARTFAEQGRMARVEGNLGLAAEWYRQALALSPDSELQRELQEIEDARTDKDREAAMAQARALADEGEALFAVKKVRSAAAKFREALALVETASWKSRLVDAEEYARVAEAGLESALSLFEKADWRGAKVALTNAQLFDAENEGIRRMLEEVRGKLARERMVRVEPSAGGKAFWIDRTEVTEADYAEFLRATRTPVPRRWKDGRPPGDGGLPIMGISALEADRYAAWAGKRLPTEAEWLAAAGAADGRAWPWGAEWKDGIANVASDGPRLAGFQPANASPCGALDMGGNVAEWTSTSGEKGRVLKGGSFLFPRESARLEWRWEEAADVALPGFGFRCVADE
ncbi:MAG: SUMF1/EgtB/PvdO family nonheme iron enzyme, partial [Candidatus Brocadiae bacterium]|nr:SUMF1/EgtB/PvdO family nonheme iron enzyme [Candidatus Brocadiia bacterium]